MDRDSILPSGERAAWHRCATFRNTWRCDVAASRGNSGAGAVDHSCTCTESGRASRHARSTDWPLGWRRNHPRAASPRRSARRTCGWCMDAAPRTSKQSARCQATASDSDFRADRERSAHGSAVRCSMNSGFSRLRCSFVRYAGDVSAREACRMARRHRADGPPVPALPVDRAQ